MSYNIHDGAFVDADGNWSREATIITFREDELTEQQWLVVDELPDSQKLFYIEAILNGEDVKEWEEQ